MTFVEKQNISSKISSNIITLFNTNHKNKKLDEPGYISVLTQDFVPIIKNILNANLKNVKFEVSGLFIHKSPIVEFVDNQPCNGQRCELGDLLIIYLRKDRYNKIVFNNSLLLQAKRNVSSIVYNDCQLWLYKKWPKFKYYKKTNNIVRSIYPKSINSGAQYLLIDENPLSIWCSKPDSVLSRCKKFEDTFVDFIECATGRQFSTNKYNPDSWTKMIYDLLTNNNNRIYKAKSAGHFNVSSTINCTNYLNYLNLSMNIIGKIDKHSFTKNKFLSDKTCKVNSMYDSAEYNNDGISTILIEGIDKNDG